MIKKNNRSAALFRYLSIKENNKCWSFGKNGVQIGGGVKPKNVLKVGGVIVVIAAGGYAIYCGINHLFSRQEKKDKHNEGVRKLFNSGLISKEEARRSMGIKETSNNSGDSTISQNADSEITPPRKMTFNCNASQINYDDWQLVGKFIGIEDLAILYCERGVGKSVMAFQIACDVANGNQSMVAPSDDGVHNPQKTIYYDAEMTENDYRRRYNGFTKPDNLDICLDFYFKTANDWLTDLKSRISEVEGDVFIVLDNITSAFKNMTAEDMRLFLVKQLRDVQEKMFQKGQHITFLIIAHTTKEGILGGTTNLQNFGTTILHLKNRKDGLVEMIVDKDRNYGDMSNRQFLLRKSNTGIKHFEYVEEITSGNNNKEDSDASASKQQDIKIQNVPIDKAIEMYGWYHDKDNKRSLADVVKEYGKEYDLKYPEQIKRVFTKVDEYLKNEGRPS